MTLKGIIIEIPAKSEDSESLEDKVKYAIQCANEGSEYHSDYLNSLHAKLLERRVKKDLPVIHQRILTLLESHHGK